MSDVANGYPAGGRGCDRLPGKQLLLAGGVVASAA